MSDRNSFLDSLKIDNRDNHIEKQALGDLESKKSSAPSFGGRERDDDLRGSRESENKPGLNSPILTAEFSTVSSSAAPAVSNTAAPSAGTSENAENTGVNTALEAAEPTADPGGNQAENTNDVGNENDDGNDADSGNNGGNDNDDGMSM